MLQEDCTTRMNTSFNAHDSGARISGLVVAMYISVNTWSLLLLGRYALLFIHQKPLVWCET